MEQPEKTIILAIETSCDETAAAVLEITSPDPSLKRRGNTFPNIKTLSSIIKSQIKLHSKMGGVVPEVAARAHVKNILPVVEKAIKNSKLKIQNFDYIAVTQGPGLIPSLIVGVEFAKALSLATGKPLIPVNHMLGHLYSPFGGSGKLEVESEKYFPHIALIVSGGHTMLVLMEDIKNYKVLGETVDDAAGEAFDKVAKLLKLPYPGGPEVSKLAEKAAARTGSGTTGTGGGPDFIFPRPMINAKNYDFSFSGLKTAVLYYLQSLPTTNYSLPTKQNVCKAFQDAVVDVLVTKTMRAAKEFKAKSVSVSGGVSANKQLRSKLAMETNNDGRHFLFPSSKLQTDNAEMIGLAAAFMLQNGYRPQRHQQIKADPNLSL